MNSKAGPAVGGTQKPGRHPRGKNTMPSRFVGLAAVCTIGVKAGTIESSSGNASDAPTPRRTVRRDRPFLVMNMTWLLRLSSSRHVAPPYRAAATLPCSAAGAALSRMLNAGLFTMPATIDENR